VDHRGGEAVARPRRHAVIGAGFDVADAGNAVPALAEHDFFPDARMPVWLTRSTRSPVASPLRLSTTIG